MCTLFQRIWRRFGKRRKKKVPSHRAPDLSPLEEALGYRFRNRELLKLALTHRSYLSVSGGSHIATNERLEFLGDSVIGLLVTEYLFTKFPQKSEGDLTQHKGIMVSRTTLSRIAGEISLGEFLFLGAGEDRSGGRHRESILADAMEAVIGAIYLDGGFEAARKVLQKVLMPRMSAILKQEIDRNYKSQLLELSQAKGYGLPEYEIRSEKGPEHAKTFEVAVRIRGKVLGVGVGTSKKRAEQEAARRALRSLNGL